MPSCLGIYIDDNLIKYAKITRDYDDIKVDSYGVKMYEENIEKTIRQIVNETYSYSGVQICLNIENTGYTYTKLFNLLNKKDLKSAIDTEFDLFCSDNGKNKNTLEYRTIETDDFEDLDKKRIVYAYAERSSIVEKIQSAGGFKINYVMPLGFTITNLANFVNNGNSAIINIENETEVTTLINGTIYKVDKIDVGLKNVIEKISQKENSYTKAYEICKKTTIYTQTSENLQVEENEYLEDIVSTVYNIIQKVKELINKNGIEISNIYLTGLGVTINNIDLLFQENFMQSKCEILVPFFIEKTNLKINIKDYIEVNSAISLALQGTGVGIKNINFGKEKKSFSELMKSDVSFGKTKKIGLNEKIPLSSKIKYSINSNADKIDSYLLRIVAFLAMFIIVYAGYSMILEKNINLKLEETNEVLEDTENKIASIEKYQEAVNSRTNDYEKEIARIENIKAKNNEIITSKNSIPNLLYEIMFAIPEDVQVLSIKNAHGKNIVIEAQAEDYSQLGYFKAKLAQEGALNNVTATQGEMQNGIVKVEISGELPY